MTAPIIEVQGLTKSYGGKRGIKGVSFDVAEGEVFGFLGPNGAGKTTTIRVLMALLRGTLAPRGSPGTKCGRNRLRSRSRSNTWATCGAVSTRPTSRSSSNDSTSIPSLDEPHLPLVATGVLAELAVRPMSPYTVETPAQGALTSGRISNQVFN